MFIRLFPKQTLRRVVAVNTVSQLITKFVSSGTVLVISLLLARSAGPDRYGDFVKITTYITFFFLLSDFGMNAFYLQRKDEMVWWDALVSARVLGGSLLVFLSLMLLTIFPQGVGQGYTRFVRMGIVLFCPAILFQSLLTSANGMFQRHLRYDLSTIAVTVGCLAALAVTAVSLWGAFSHDVVYGAIAAMLLGSAVMGIAGMMFARTLSARSGISFPWRRMKELFVCAFPLGITLLFNLVYSHADSVILTLSRTTREVGIYGLSYKVFEWALVLPTFFMNAVYPPMLRALNHKAGDVSMEFMKLLRNSLRFLLPSSVFLLILLWVGAPLLSFIRQDFAASTAPLRVLSLGLPFFFASSAVMWALIALGRPWVLAVLYGVSMAANITANAFYIPRFGYMAAAWITVLSEGLVLLCSFIVLQKVLQKSKQGV
ncbi:polysaccharide biosynthesis C-terminal domain-containing protein [Patescibacteria group bacterium]|nr:polysaccharide biosynthesis C-terminal domain-containing protein [Patescibacteria group bacterium]MBU2543956.1 polysaccharide biosynthesis C-terminal domain-containing protein [Patescibacteria group bacterium]